MAKIEQSVVTRVMRAAVKIGDDYYTIEESVTLPTSASDDDIREAVDTGLRIYEAQRTAVEQQVRELRDQVVAQPLPVQIREPDAPASDKQRTYMDYLLRELNWDSGQLEAFAAERGMNLETLTKREASELIDQLKQIQSGGTEAAGEPEAPSARPEPQQTQPAAQQRQAILPIGERATQRQLRALERLADERGIDLEGELHTRFGGRPLDELSMDEAGQLLSEWQQRPRQVRAQNMRRAA